VKRPRWQVVDVVVATTGQVGVFIIIMISRILEDDDACIPISVRTRDAVMGPKYTVSTLKTGLWPEIANGAGKGCNGHELLYHTRHTHQTSIMRSLFLQLYSVQ
jgi:hypothetical protein